MAWKVSACALLLLGVSVFAAPVLVEAAPCPVAGPTKFVQNDAGSGRDAGDARDDAVSVGADGWQWGFVDGPSYEGGFQDISDWFSADIPPGPHDVTVRLAPLVNHLLFEDGDVVPYYVWLEVYRDGAASTFYDAAIWDPPFTFQADGERILLHVYIGSVLNEPLCEAAPAPAAVAPLPPEAQTYGTLFACSPACKV